MLTAFEVQLMVFLRFSLRPVLPRHPTSTHTPLAPVEARIHNKAMMLAYGAARGAPPYLQRADRNAITFMQSSNSTSLHELFVLPRLGSWPSHAFGKSAHSTD
ncbi:hypothetical protein UPYG_G00088830 [Umbra pygmaea]|uniref:Secreted protein n=1 Tax=Umbra pygmaea TaxID=75934 RepID=A0ABD0XFB9_UMBPY